MSMSDLTSTGSTSSRPRPTLVGVCVQGWLFMLSTSYTSKMGSSFDPDIYHNVGAMLSGSRWDLSESVLTACAQKLIITLRIVSAVYAHCLRLRPRHVSFSAALYTMRSEGDFIAYSKIAAPCLPSFATLIKNVWHSIYRRRFGSVTIPYSFYFPGS